MTKKSLLKIILISQLILLFGLVNSSFASDNKLPISKIIFDEKTKIITTKTTDGKEEILSTKDSQKNLNVVLGVDFIEYGNDDNKNLISFSKKKIFSFDKNGEQIADVSLYAHIAFRDMELLNRVGLRRMTDAAKLNVGKLNDITLSEHLFSIESKAKDKSPIIKKETADQVSYYSDDSHLFSYSKQNSAKLKKKEIAQLVKFLRYNYGIHPQILSEFEKKSYLPQNIKITFYELNKREIELTTSSYDNKIQEYQTLVPSNYSKITNNTQFSNIIWKAQKLSDEDIKNGQQAVLDRAVKSAEQKKFLPAILSFLSYSNLGLDPSNPFPKEFYKFKADMANDNDVRKVFYALNPDNFAKNPQAMIAMLSELEKKGGEDIEMLLVFKANHLLSSTKFTTESETSKEYAARSKKTSEAMELFNRALSKNPLLAGAWIDLGKIFHKSFRTFEAYQCYNIAKKLSPNHGMLKPIYEVEKKFELQYPEFF